VIFNPKYSDVFDKYNLKQKTRTLDDILNGKNTENEDGNGYDEIDGGSAKNSRDTDDMGSPFSAMSDNDFGGDNMLNFPLGISEQYLAVAKNNVYENGRQDYIGMKKPFNNQKPFKNRDQQQRLKLGVDRPGNNASK